MSLFKQIECVYLASDRSNYLVKLHDENKRDQLKELIPSTKRDHESGDWLVPGTSEYGAALRLLNVPFSKDAFKFKLQSKRKELELIELSKSIGAELDLPGFGKPPRPFQNAGILYALARQRVIIGDEMGLGKTIQGLGVLFKLGPARAYPALIVTPSSNKYQWLDEIAACIPGAVVILAEKNTPQLLLQAADIIVTNYEQLVGFRTIKSKITVEKTNDQGEIDYEQQEQKSRTSWHDPAKKKVVLSPLAEKLRQLGLKAIIADEAHYIKEPGAARTCALMEIRHSAKYRLLLTGTPMLNRPSELYSLFKFLDRIAEFGGYWHFHKYYCDQKKGQFGIEAKGAKNTIELNTKMRSTCYIRRKKSEVLTELPPKQRTTIAVDITNREEYDKAEKELIEWVKDRVEKDKTFMDSIAHLPEDQRKEAIAQRKDFKAACAERGEEMVRITALKTVAAEGKLKAAKEWIDNFMASGEKITIFASHLSILRWLIKTYPHAARIMAEDAPEVRQQNVARFQNDPACQMIIGAMGTSATNSPAGLGHTLTAASNSLTLELGWNSGFHDQLEDRNHRYGQRDSVNCYYLVAKKTIEQKIAELIESKRGIAAQVQDGEYIEEGTGIMDDLIEYLAAAA